MSFSFKWQDHDFSYLGVKGTVLFNEQRVCEIETWAFHSCACFLLQYWNVSVVKNWNRKTATEFWNFLTKKHGKLNWHPDEVLFLISDSQMGGLKPIWKRKDVRLRDRFTNKSHGPNDVYLFRYSKAGDWQRRVINA